jgi:hypothetical protein
VTPNSSVNPGNPEPTQHPALVAPIPVGKLQRLHDRLVGLFKDFTPAGTKAFGQLQNFLMALAGNISSFYSHGFFLLTVRD